MRKYKNEEGYRGCDEVRNPGVVEVAIIRNKLGPSEAAESVGSGAEIYHFVYSIVYKVGPWNRALAARKERVFCREVHYRNACDGEENYDWLEGDKEASEEEDVDHVDILVADFELHLLVEGVEFILVEPAFVDYIIGGLLGRLDHFDVSHR